MNLTQYAEQFIGVKYTWGGNTVEQGFDCSGFVCEVLRSQNFLDKRDLTAKGLYDHFSKIGYSSNIEPGTLLFFGKSTDNITHTALALTTDQMIEAGGEGSTATTEGFVRVRHIKSRKDLVASLNIQRVYDAYK